MPTLHAVLQSPRRVPALRALRHRNFRWFWFGGLGQTTGQGMMQLTLAWLVLALTDSVSQFGFVVFLQGLPMVLLVMFGGVLADRIDRRHVLVVGQTIMVANIFALATLAVTEFAQIWHIYISAVITGLVQGFTMPARSAYIRSLVARDDIMNATALNSMLMNTSRILGPTLAGFLIAFFGMGATLYFNGSLYLVGVGSLLFIRGVPKVQRTVRTSAAGDLIAGLRYARSTPVVFAIVLLALSMGFFGMPYVQMTPVFAKEVMGLGPREIGILLGAAGGGSLLGNMVLASMGNPKHKNQLLIGLILLFAASLFAFAFSPWFALSVALLFLVGLGSTTAISVLNAILQLVVPQELLGRVMSLTLVGASLMFVGALPMGLLGDLWGLRVAMALGAAVLLALVIVLGIVWTPLRRASV